MAVDTANLCICSSAVDWSAEQYRKIADIATGNDREEYAERSGFRETAGRCEAVALVSGEWARELPTEISVGLVGVFRR